MFKSVKGDESVSKYSRLKRLSTGCCEQGPVKVVLSENKNPSKSPFTKGDFQFPPLEKAGVLDKRHWCNQFTDVKLTLP